MRVLTAQQRNILEKAVIRARNIAEEGATNGLKNLAVDQFEPFQHQTPEQRSLRNVLRAKARLLGDERLDNGAHEIQNLAYELAYEYWHKLLFARFLEANNLLIHPTMGVAVTLEELEELAPEEGYADKWDAAASYASHMLPAIFRMDDPLMQVSFATNDRIALESILNSLEPEIFTTNDALGWVYQFWQTEVKAAINASDDKIDGERLPAVTQLFTEPYMVDFLIDNTLGAWWVSRNRGVKPPVEFEYLRLLDDGAPAAGSFEGWPDKTAEVTTLDPCMGSGHFVASLFPVLAELRMFEEGLTKEQAADKVITENLHGLEIDPRCTQIAAFNVALTAWKFCGHYKELPEMNLACSGIAPKGKVEDWIKLVGEVERAEDKTRMENGMKMLYKHFQLAPELGSLLDPTTIKADAFTASFEELQPALKKALENEGDSEQFERGVMAAGIAKAGQLLSNKYTLQITNVPYLSKGKQNTIISNYCERNFPSAKDNLATVFLIRMLKSLIDNGTVANVTLQDWLFQKNSEKLRQRLLKNSSWSFLARLGSKSFQTIMYDFNVMLVSIQNRKPFDDFSISCFDVSDKSNAQNKAEALIETNLINVNQTIQYNNPNSSILLEGKYSDEKCVDYCNFNGGITTGDALRFRFKHWEINDFKKWSFQQTTVKKSELFSGREDVILWENGVGVLSSTYGATIAGRDVWGKKGISITHTGEIKSTLYTGQLYENVTTVAIPLKEEYLLPLWCYYSSTHFNKAVRKINQKIRIDVRYFENTEINLDDWQKIAEEKYPNGLPKPYSDDPTQWLFHGHPIKTDNPLQVALARLLGYRWPAESDTEMELADEGRELIDAVKTFDYLTDDDGIFCIPSVNAEREGAERLRDYLQQVFAGEWNNNTITQLLEKEDAKASNLETWLRNEFFVQHCKVFKNRPFIWHIWDGRKDGFSALVNYHKLDKDNLSKLIYTYLGDWIRMCEAKVRDGESGADGLLSAALQLKENLEHIYIGERPYDIFVRWKQLEEQPIGWEPDLNDGVRLNIRPFVEAGVLRSKFNVKWGVDRGKNPEGSPWGEKRDNDKHLSLEEKRQARENK